MAGNLLGQEVGRPSRRPRAFVPPGRLGAHHRVLSDRMGQRGGDGALKALQRPAPAKSTPQPKAEAESRRTPGPAEAVNSLKAPAVTTSGATTRDHAAASRGLQQPTVESRSAVTSPLRSVGVGQCQQQQPTRPPSPRGLAEFRNAPPNPSGRNGSAAPAQQARPGSRGSPGRAQAGSA